MRPLLGQTLVVVLIGSGAFVVAVRAGIALDFDQCITLDAQHILVIHNGPQPTCSVIPAPRSTIASGQAQSAVRSRWIICRRTDFGRYSGSGCRNEARPNESARSA
jgi:hypothetical protein